MKIIRIDLDVFEDKKSFHRWLRDVCEFPEYYGCNLDALYDCLSENNHFKFEIVDSTQNEMYILSLMKIFRKTKCEYEVIDK